ncbi:RNA polymerase Rpb3/Rpb11 dimerisation domain protein [uncultured archaeon]|nr:RNA polymerase Rpb3/Rpb11 dimerisation domain protein [uncultured archaeon]
MHINVIEDETKSFIAEFEDTDRSVVELIREKLADNKDVEFSSIERDHPEAKSMRLVVKSSKNAKSIVLKAIDDLQDEIKEISSQIPKK